MPRNRGRIKRLLEGVTAGLVLVLLMAPGVLPATTLVNRPAPPFARTDLNGSRVNLAEYRGKVVLLNFWATWCAPCRIEMPRFVAWQKQYGSEGLQVVGVSMDDDAQPVRAFVRGVRTNYPVLMGDAKLGELYGGVLGVPVTFLIDRKGMVRARYEGEADLSAIEVELRALLQSH